MKTKFKEFLNEYYFFEPTYSEEVEFTFKVPLSIYITIYPEKLEEIIIKSLKKRKFQYKQIDIHEIDDLDEVNGGFSSYEMTITLLSKSKDKFRYMISVIFGDLKEEFDNEINIKEDQIDILEPRL